MPFEIIDKNGRTIRISAQVLGGAVERGQQSLGYKSGDEILKELLNKYVPDHELPGRP